MTGTATHFVRDGQHDVRCSLYNTRRIANRDSHHRVRILVARVVIGRERDSVRREPVLRRFELHGLRLIAPSGHLVPGKTGVGRRGGPEQRLRERPEIGFPRRRYVDGTLRVRHRFVGDSDAGWGDHQLAGGIDHLGVNRVVWRQYGENRVVSVHTVHSEIVPCNDGPAARLGKRWNSYECSQEKRRTQPIEYTT